MKKLAMILLVPLLGMSMVSGIKLLSGSVSSQTPAATPTTAPESAQTESADAYANRPLGRWQTQNMVFLNTIIKDTKKTLEYIDEENLAYAEVACGQLMIDIWVLRGKPVHAPAREPLSGSRALALAPSGYACPPIPDAVAQADLNAGLAQLEQAVNHLITGIKTSNGPMIMAAEPEMQAAAASFDKVLVDMGQGK